MDVDTRINQKDKPLTRADVDLHLQEVGGSDKLDLSSQNLQDADLSHLNLSKANLSRANLFSVNLIHADLSCANLSDASLILLSGYIIASFQRGYE